VSRNPKVKFIVPRVHLRSLATKATKTKRERRGKARVPCLQVATTTKRKSVRTFCFDHWVTNVFCGFLDVEKYLV
jgi:hypothetical protein